MFDFLRKPGARHPAQAIRRALESEPVRPGTEVAALGIVTKRGSYAGRKVTYFRVFDPSSAAAHAPDVFNDYSYDDLGAHPELVLREGFLERDDSVIFSGPPLRAVGPRQRERADRDAHADDERFVFPDTDAARKQARS